MLQEVLTMSLCCELIQDNGTDNLHYPINFDILNSSIRWTAAFCRLTVMWMTLFSLSTALYSQILLLHLHFSTFTQTPSGTNKCRTDHFIFWPSPGLFMHKTCGMCWPLLISLRAFEIIEKVDHNSQEESFIRTRIIISRHKAHDMYLFNWIKVIYIWILK